MTVNLPLLSVMPFLCHLLNPPSGCRVQPVTVTDGAMKLALSNLFTQPQEVSCGVRNFSPFMSNHLTTRYLLLDEQYGFQQVDF